MSAIENQFDTFESNTDLDNYYDKGCSKKYHTKERYKNFYLSDASTDIKLGKSLEIIKVTQKAVLVENNVWLPKSRITIKDNKVVAMDEWLFSKNGFLTTLNILEKEEV